MLGSAPRSSPDLNYYYGVALAHLERLPEAHNALQAGAQLAPQDKRFPIELAGVAFKEKNFKRAKIYLHRALRLDPKDAYATDFLATIYYLEGDLEAALKYWNRIGKPEIAQVLNEPPLRVRPALLDHTFAFAPKSVLTLDQLLTSEARTRMLEIFTGFRFDVNARVDSDFDTIFRAQELNGFGNTKLEALFRMFSGLVFEEITPEYYNLNQSAMNIRTLYRFDTDKRRTEAWFSAPLAGDPKWRYRVGVDFRNENWTVQTSFTGPSTFLAALNMQREAIAAEIRRQVGARWSWLVAVELSHRDYRNVNPGIALTPQLLAQGYQIKQTASLGYELWRSPERRFTITSGLSSQAGKLWSNPDQSFEKLQASLEARWFPRALGDDWESHLRLRGGKTFGQISFDELYMLGVEHDNDLSMRAHKGVRDGEKGSSPLGQNYVLSNWETDKNIFSNGYFSARLGPTLDIGKSWDPSAGLGSHKWLFDLGIEAKLKVLGVGVILSYGKDLRSGNNAYFANVKP